MIVVSSREFRDNQKKFFDLAEEQRVIIKRKNQFLELVSHGNVIPESISPSNDPYFDDPRNIADINAGMQEAKEGKAMAMLEGESLDDFLNRIEKCTE
ncbi:prevent-host-death protein [Parabacteroides sp. OttesenSCG-928-K15]|nr:prevent-host-death protein [Parabacteroides sp. OttesenSCG-928-K15]